MYKKSVLAILICSALAACNSNDHDSVAAPTVQTGVLLDSAVAGIQYKTTTQQGVTNAQGEFKYLAGESVVFSMGGIILGDSQGANKLLLKQLNKGMDNNGKLSQRSINRAVLLQSLDSDADAHNGIQLSPALLEALKNKTLTESAFDAANFNSATLTALVTELQGKGLTVAMIDDKIALDHLLQTEANTKGHVTQTINDALISSIQRFVVPNRYVDYKGVDSTIKAQFPQGFLLAVGSGLYFNGKEGDALTFYAITDRGPNGDSPKYKNGDAAAVATKTFPAPHFTPTLAKISITDKAEITSVKPLNNSGVNISGLPIPKGTIGSSGETPLNEKLAPINTDSNGLDSEALAKDSAGNLWTCDEYGPFIVKMDTNGKILKKYSPSVELPAILAQRQANRGCEGLTITPNGNVYALIQSTLDVDGKTKAKALFTRIVELNPTTGATKMFGYPIVAADYATDVSKPKNNKAKLGDIVALNNTQFLVIEQGEFADGKIHNYVYLLDLANATDLSAKKVDAKELEYVTKLSDLTTAQIVLGSKKRLFDLKDYGWLAEKAEGLALIDSKTIAIINDNDFGLGVKLSNTTETDPTALTVDNNGVMTPAEANKVVGYQLVKGKVEERATQLWIIKTKTDLSKM